MQLAEGQLLIITEQAPFFVLFLFFEGFVRNPPAVLFTLSLCALTDTTLGAFRAAIICDILIG